MDSTESGQASGGWPSERLLKICDHYAAVLRRAKAATGERRQHLFGITRRTRRRLTKIGVVLRERPDGDVLFSQRLGQGSARGDADAKLASEIALYIRDHKLVFGNDTSRPSWAIALNRYRLSTKISRLLQEELPALIGEYTRASTALISEALQGTSDGELEYLLSGVPPELLRLWRFALSHGEPPLCVRPDFLIDEAGNLRIIEFNVDLRLDRGIATGVSEYSRDLLLADNEFVLHCALPSDYAESARQISSLSRPKVAVVISDEYRSEYANQEEYFCRSLSDATGLDCRLVHLKEMAIDVGSGLLIEVRTGQTFDVAVLELELLDQQGKVRPRECAFIESLLTHSRTKVLGSILPFADKLLSAIVRRLKTTSPALAAILVPTDIISRTQFDATVLKDCARHKEHVVLKAAGIDPNSTGSKSVLVCSDVGADEWSLAIDRAMTDVESRGRCWLLQPRIEPKRYRVRYKLKPNGHTREAPCFVRLCAFYTLDYRSTKATGAGQAEYVFSGALATAGTDEETLKRGMYKIHALRQATYMTVSEDGGEPANLTRAS